MNKDNKKKLKLLFFVFFGILILILYLGYVNQNISQPFKYEIDKKL